MVIYTNPYLGWATKEVCKQIKNCKNLGYLDFHVPQETGVAIFYGNSRKRLIKLLQKIIAEKTYVNPDKQLAMRKVCNNIIYNVGELP
jgi:hypothetical protein